MPIIPVSSEPSARIAARIESMQGDEVTPPWLAARAREMNALPTKLVTAGNLVFPREVYGELKRDNTPDRER